MKTVNDEPFVATNLRKLRISVATASLLLLAAAAAQGGALIVNTLGTGANARPVVDASGVPIPVGGGYIAVGTFGTLDDAAITALGAAQDWPTLIADFQQFGVSGSIARFPGIVEFAVRQKVSAGDAFDGKNAYIVIGNKIDPAASDNWIVYKDTGMFDSTREPNLSIVTQLLTATNDNILVGSLGSKVTLVGTPFEDFGSLQSIQLGGVPESSIVDDEIISGPEVTLCGWQYPNGAVLRDLSYQDFLMQHGTLLGAFNFGHGTEGDTTTVAGIPFTNTGSTKGNPTGEMAPGVTYAVTGMPTVNDGLEHAGIDDLSFSEVSGTIGTLSVGGLDPAQQYVVQLLCGEPRAVQATNWTVGGDLKGLVGNIGGSGTSYPVSGLGQGPLGNGVAGENPPNIGDRRILTFGVSGRVTFSFKNFGWTGKAASFSGFQIRKISEYPPSPQISLPTN